MMLMLNVGAGAHRPEGWVNVDVVDVPENPPLDVLATVDNPYPFDPGTVDRVLLSHTLEHIPWGDLPDFIAQMCRVCKTGAEVLIVGPDTDRALAAWKRGEIGDDLLWAVLESWGPGPLEFPYRHSWNCSETRVVQLLTQLGLSATPLGLDHGILPDLIPMGWPIGNRSGWQFAVLAVIPAELSGSG